jgi:mevalonate kinase
MIVSGTACAKLILCGEHAVVYGRPAIALPLTDLRASVAVEQLPAGAGIRLRTPNLELPPEADDPLIELARIVAVQLAIAPDLGVTIHSDIPIASGMGSGAAVATALVRALAALSGHTLAPEAISALVYASEQRFHGTPSGIDNTVIAHERPIWYCRGEQATIEPITVGVPLTLVIGDTGVRSATRLPVGWVRERRTADPAQYDAIFEEIGRLVAQIRDLLAAGDLRALGAYLNANHELLQRLGVSSPELDRLVEAARGAGALGAKLSGAGWGGVMLALTEPDRAETIARALRDAGAVRALVAAVGSETARSD